MSIGLVWLFVYFISTLPIAITNNGREHGGFFVRAGAWVRLNKQLFLFLVHFAAPSPSY
jgi:hypothetical protein